MTRKEAAQALVELLAKYEDKLNWGASNRYYEAVTIACGVLQVDDVLRENALQPEDIE